MDFRAKALLAAALAVVTATGALARSGFKWEELQLIDQKWPQAKATTTGLRYVVTREGQGEQPKAGDRVKVLYKGMFLDGRVFDQTLDPQKPFTFRLERGDVIAGWEEGIALMRVGEQRTLIVPYDLAYGSRGKLPGIPRQTSLVFEVELLSFETNPAATRASAQP